MLTEDSVVDISWFKGSGDEFVTESKNMNTYAPHKIYNTLTYVNRDRAVSIMMATIQIRLPVQGIMCEVNSDTKLLFRTQKKEGQWYIAGFTSYEQATRAWLIQGLAPDEPSIMSFRKKTLLIWLKESIRN